MVLVLVLVLSFVVLLTSLLFPDERNEKFSEKGLNLGGEQFVCLVQLLLI